MISLQQIRAARGLMNWSQSDLARESGLSVTAMNNIDRGLSTPRLATMETIQTLFENNGIEFTAGHGVRLVDEVFNVQSYIGEEAIVNYFTDVLETLKKTRQPALHILADETEFLESPALRKAIFNYYLEFRKHSLFEKVLMREGVMERYGSKDCAAYRWCSEELAEQIGTSIYGNKYCIFLTDRIVTIENAAIADSYRQQFEANWKRAKPVPPRKSIFEEDLERYKGTY